MHNQRSSLELAPNAGALASRGMGKKDKAAGGKKNHAVIRAAENRLARWLRRPMSRWCTCILLLATPKADQKRPLEVLAAFATTITRDVNLREQLYHARNAAHAYNVLHADEAEDINYFIDDAMERAGVREDKN